MSLVLAQNFGSFAALASAEADQLAAVHEIGDVIAKSVHDFFRSAHGKHIVGELKAVGLDPQMEKKAAAADAPLAGLSIVVTGTMVKFKADEIEALITEHGGRPSGSVSKKTAFLIAGEEAGSKLDKAKALGVPVITEKEFLAKIGKS